MAKYVYSMPNGKYVPNHSNDAVYEIKFGRVARLICWFMGIVVFLCFVWLYVLHNLWSNSVYYAKHTPNTKVAAPEIIMLIDNLKYMHRPKEPGLSYDFDGSNTIGNCFVPDTGSCVYLGESGKAYAYHTEDEFYNLDSNLNLVVASDWTDFNGEEARKIPNSEVNIDKLYKEIYEAAKPVLELNKKEPNLNLQWIFNWYYHDRFN